MARPWILTLSIAAAVAAAVVMVILGWPEDTPAQQALLELSPLLLQVALGLGLWHLSGRMRPLGGPGRLALLAASCLGGIGVVVVALAYLTGPRGMVPAGLAVLWLALLAVMAVVVSHLPRRLLRADSLFRIESDPDEDDEEYDETTGPAEPAPGQGPVAPAQGDR